MELNEFKSMWQTYDAKLENSLKLNLHCLDLIQTQRVKSKLAPLFWQRVMECVLHGIAIGLLFAFLINNLFQLQYAVSAAALLAFYIMAFVNSLKQIVMIKRMDFSNDIITIQSSLVLLQTHSVNYMRLLCLFIPTFVAYPIVVSKVINDFDLQSLRFMDVLSQYKGDWWRKALISSVAMLPVFIWLYNQISFKNMHKPWVKRAIRKFSGTSVTKSIEFVNELEALKHDLVK